MTAKSERLTVLSDAEQEALYGLPDFDDTQRLEYLALTEAELAFAGNRPGVHIAQSAPNAWKSQFARRRGGIHASVSERNVTLFDGGVT